MINEPITNETRLQIPDPRLLNNEQCFSAVVLTKAETTSDELIRHLSRTLYKSTLFYAKQTQFQKRSNERKFFCKKGL